jgi:hypothetical protein
MLCNCVIDDGRADLLGARFNSTFSAQAQWGIVTDGIITGSDQPALEIMITRELSKQHTIPAA